MLVPPLSKTTGSQRSKDKYVVIRRVEAGWEWMWGKVEKSTHSEEGEVFGLTEGAAKLQRWVWYRTLSSITLSHSFLAPFYSSYILAIFFFQSKVCECYIEQIWWNVSTEIWFRGRLGHFCLISTPLSLIYWHIEYSLGVWHCSRH